MRPWLFLAGVNGVIAVGFGAYASHGLAGDAHLQSLADMASRYQLIHALALLAVDRLAADRRPLAGISGLFFFLGTLLFCWSLYAKALAGGDFPIPMVTPAGGICFMIAWVVLAVGGVMRGR